MQEYNISRQIVFYVLHELHFIVRVDFETSAPNLLPVNTEDSSHRYQDY